MSDDCTGPVPDVGPLAGATSISYAEADRAAGLLRDLAGDLGRIRLPEPDTGAASIGRTRAALDDLDRLRADLSTHATRSADALDHTSLLLATVDGDLAADLDRLGR